MCGAGWFKAYSTFLINKEPKLTSLCMLQAVTTRDRKWQ
jgi:hypothetical protein